MSRASYPRSSTILAASAITSGFAPKSCAVMGMLVFLEIEIAQSFFGTAGNASELVNSVISRPQPPETSNDSTEERVGDAGHGGEDGGRLMVKSRILYDAGIIFVRRGLQMELLRRSRRWFRVFRKRQA